MKQLADLLFEANFLKKVPRSGFQFLGAGSESVAEHSFTAAFIALVMSRMVPEADSARLVAMCLVHDLPEARMGDLNYVQKQYVKADEAKALADGCGELPMGNEFRAWIEEFNQGTTVEARLANDADQLSLILELKTLSDIGYSPPGHWLPNVLKRLKTDTGRRLAAMIMESDHDHWWRKIFVDSNNVPK